MLYSDASALLIELNKPFDKSAFESFIKDSATDGMSGVIVAPVENMKRLAIAITYGPLTTEAVLRRAADEVLPSSFIVGYVKPRGEGRSWNGLVRDFEVSDRAWGVEAADPVRNVRIYVKTLTGKTVMHFSPRRLGCSLQAMEMRVTLHADRVYGWFGLQD